MFAIIHGDEDALHLLIFKDDPPFTCIKGDGLEAHRNCDVLCGYEGPYETIMEAAVAAYKESSISFIVFMLGDNWLPKNEKEELIKYLNDNYIGYFFN